jgi:hypothetical protein
MSDMITLPLSKEIDAYGKPTNQLELRAVTGEDLITLGHPMTISGDGSFTFRMDVIAMYISKLASIPMSSVKQMSPKDLNEAATTVAGFLGE